MSGYPDVAQGVERVRVQRHPTVGRHRRRDPALGQQVERLGDGLVLRAQERDAFAVVQCAPLVRQRDVPKFAFDFGVNGANPHRAAPFSVFGRNERHFFPDFRFKRRFHRHLVKKIR